LHDVISSGSYTTIYKTACQNCDTVAIKVPTRAASTAVEHYYLSRIAHPSIIELLDSVQTPLGPALVIPYAAGDDLFNAATQRNGTERT
jgi:hypothetical protein